MYVLDRIVKKDSKYLLENENKFKIVNVYLIGWFYRHINPFRVILRLEVKESRSLYIHIHIFRVVIFKSFFLHTTPYDMNILKKSIWPIDGTLTGTNTPSQSGHGSNGN